MKKLVLFLVIFAVSKVCFASVELTESNFKQTISSNKTVLVMVYKHGCSWCDKTYPVVSEFEKKNPGVVVGKLDGVKETPLRESLKIFSGTPTFIKYVDGKEVGGWVGFRDIDHMNNEFDNPKPLDHSEARQPQQQQQKVSDGEIAANFFYLNQRINHLSIALLLVSVLSIVAICRGGRK